MIRSRTLTSTLPPEITHTAFLPLMSTLLYIAAATETAPAPSATILCFSISFRIAEAISSSVTVTTPSTYFWHIANVRSPGCLTAIPSAIVLTEARASVLPTFRAFCMEGAPAACTPYTLQLGLICFTAKATPPIRPPPPMGTRTTSASFTCSIISRPTVP